jgi:DNA mismatch repair protein MutS2
MAVVEGRDLETLELPRVLAAVAGHARSEAGREQVLALAPSADRGDVEHRLEVVEELRTLAAEASRAPTADVARLGPALSAAAPHGSALDGHALVAIRDLLAVSRAVRAHLLRDPVRFPTLATMAETLPEIPGLLSQLRRTLDERGDVREEASPPLAAARAASRELRVQIERRLVALVRDPDLAGTVGDRYVTLRNGRYVVPVRQSAAWTFPGVVQDRSGSEETVFVEPLFAVELNNQLILALGNEETEERRVRAELTTLVRRHAAAIRVLEEALATIDCLAAAAGFAAEHACTRPHFVDGGIRLPSARHPLLAIAHRTVVPIDLVIPDDRRGLAISGPNAGGKTVALKTLGLAAVMAQAGLFVFAGEGVELPFFDAVVADIGDDQSIEYDLSTFTGHAVNLARIARAAGPRTLVVLDEPGAGTDPVEGAALAVGVLTDLVARGPHLAFSTHFPQVKTFALADPALEVAAFDVDPETGAPRFSLVYHTIGRSLALPIARRHGIPDRALEVAESLLAGESQDLVRAVERLEDSRHRLDDARTEAERTRVALAATEAQVATLREELAARKRQRWEADLGEARAFLADLEHRGRALLKDLESGGDPGRLGRFLKDERRAVRTRASTVVPEPATGPGRSPVPGDTVEVAGSGIRGELLDVTGERARIRRGGMRFEVPSRQLRVVDAGAPRERVHVTLAPPVAPEGDETELNLTGLRVGDAVDSLARFLDRAVRTGVDEVRVVHGLGTGALRRAVHQFLATSPYCAKYREAELDRGGAAVTIAQLA